MSATKWSSPLTPAREPAPRGRIDWVCVVVWLGGVLGPWLLLASTVAFLEGWL